MGGISSIQLREDDIQDIKDETGFSRHQISRLYSRFTSLDKNNRGVLGRDDFLRIPELAINPLVDRIVHAFFRGSCDNTVNFRDFMRILARFRPIKRDPNHNKLNSLDEKLRFAFKMYDLDGDDMIARDELLTVLHMLVGEHLTDDEVSIIADRTFAEVDVSRDDYISYDEFAKAMDKVDVEHKMSICFLH